MSARLTFHARKKSDTAVSRETIRLWRDSAKR